MIIRWKLRIDPKGIKQPYWDTGWYKWFAWYPVKINNKIIWGKFIEKRITQKDYMDSYACPKKREYRI